MGHKERLLPFPLPVRLSGALLPDTQNFYDSVLTSAQQLQYEKRLHGVTRMKKLRDMGLVPEGFSESNLEHTHDVLAKERDWSEKYPSLNTYMVDAQRGTIVHDSGEIHPLIGDVQPTGRTIEDERKKRLEPFAARLMMGNFIQNPQALELVRVAYDKYQANRIDDVATQIARFADKAQGTVDHADKLFNKYRHPDKVDIISAHLIHTIPQMLIPAMNIFVGLGERQARLEVRDMILEEFSTLAKYAPRNIVNSFRNGFAA